MGQTNLSNINTYSDNATKAYAESAYSKQAKLDTKAFSAAGDVEGLLSVRYNKDVMGNEATAMVDGFEEYIKQQQQQLKEEEAVTEAYVEEEAKDAAEELARSLTHEELAKLSMLGIDVESANPSDVMSMVNTLRGDAARLERIETIKDIVKPKDEVPATITDFSVAKEDVVYLIKNKLELTEANIYKAHFSGIRLNSGNPALYEEMESQIDKVIAQAGYQVNDQTKEAGRILLANELPVTTDNIRKYFEYEEIIDKNISEIEMSKLPDIEQKYETAAKKLVYDVAHIDINAVYEMSKKSMEITVASAFFYGENKGEYLPYEQDNDLKAVTSMRQMEEIRLSMTLTAARRLVGKDINIDTRDLTTLVAKLKDVEQNMATELLRRNDIEPTEDNVNITIEVSRSVTRLSEAHAAVIAAPLKEIPFTPASLLSENSSYVAIKTTINFEAVSRSYEAVGTEVRRDLGDSISKAFSNVDDILKEMNLEVSYENQRAVRILGYNSLEITHENIRQIVGYDRQVNELIDNFYPEAVMGIIKDGINPMDMSIEELNQVIRERNYNEGVSEAENFAAYLRNIESMGEITPEQRESYIGIYRLMNKLSKHGNREAGWLFANGSRLTVRNLIGAARSARATGMDVTVDTDFGLLDEINIKGNKIDEQIESAYKFSEEDAEIFSNEELARLMQNEQIQYTLINAKASHQVFNTPGGIYDLVKKVYESLGVKSFVKEEAVDEETENMADSLTGDEIPFDIMPESLIEALNGTEEMEAKYKELQETLLNAMYKASGEGLIGSADISSIKTVAAGYNILGTMAKNERYQIPFATEEGYTVMNLKVVHDEAMKGHMEINYSLEAYGNISADIFLSGEALTGSITSDTSDGNVALAAKAERVRAEFTEAGYTAEAVSFGTINRDMMDGAADIEVSGNAIYRAAVTSLKILAKI